MLEFSQKLKLIKFALMIIIFHIVMAIFHERIMRRPYDSHNNEPPERFSYAIAFVGVQCFVYTFVAKAVLMLNGNTKNETPQRYFAIPAIFYILASFFSNIALAYVPYTTQVVFKSSKPIVVMILGVFIGRKSYTPQKYIFVMIIVLSVILFSYNKKYETKDGEDPARGMVYMSLSLLMDGFLCAFQDRMRSVSNPTPFNLMFFINAWSSLYVIAPLIITGEGVDFIHFCIRHPQIVADLLIVVAVGTIAQIFIAKMISNFGSLPLCLTMTVRKILTVLLSVMIFHNVLSMRQWLAAGTIFLALILDAVFLGKSKSSDDSEKSNESSKESEIIIIVDEKINNNVIVSEQMEHIDNEFQSKYEREILQREL